MPNDLSPYLDTILANDLLHCKWLNTLSMMENIGATKIVKSEHPFEVTENVLKHAAEETRHAYYLKRQIKKIIPGVCPTYGPEHVLNARKSFQYLHHLDAQISRALRLGLNLSGKDLKRHAYILVTYAVELRADALYACYQTKLTEVGSPVSVRGIIVEEEQHLAEMEAEIEGLFENANAWRTDVRQIEHRLYHNWIEGLAKYIQPSKQCIA